MAKSPIKIKDYQNNFNKFNTSRKQLLEEEDTKIIGSKGFIFKKYKTERQRLDEYLKGKEIISEDNNKSNSKTKSSILFIQPNMRFRARNNLERICDSVNRVNYGRVNPEIMRKSYIIKKKINEKDENDSDKDKNKNSEKCYYENNSSSEMIRVSNSHARNLMSDLYNKTHFKGAFTFTLYNSPKNYIQNNSNKEHIRPDHKYNSFDNKFPNLDKINTNSSSEFRNEYGKYKDLSPLNHPLNFNPLTNKLLAEVDFEKLELIKKLAYLKKEDDKIDLFSKGNKIKTVKFLKRISSKFDKQDLLKDLSTRKSVMDIQEFDYNNKTDDEKIIINGELFSKSDLDKISKKVLTSCNFTHNKNHNNPKSHLSGEGKMMFTGGMTVKAFSSKYCLKP